MRKFEIRTIGNNSLVILKGFGLCFVRPNVSNIPTFYDKVHHVRNHGGIAQINSYDDSSEYPWDMDDYREFDIIAYVNMKSREEVIEYIMEEKLPEFWSWSSEPEKYPVGPLTEQEVLDNIIYALT